MTRWFQFQVENVTNTLQNELKSCLASIERCQCQLNEILNYVQETARTQLPRNCKEVQNEGYYSSGSYKIHPTFASDSFAVLCDMKIGGGGWVYLLNRFDGSQNFDLKWVEYKQGFGSFASEFWLGLERLYQLTNDGASELLIELVDWDRNVAYAHYDSFEIGSEQDGYYLKELGTYSGDAGDALRHHLGMKFTTKDIDQDEASSGNCAYNWKGGWWYKACGFCSLTQPYKRGRMAAVTGKMFWEGFHGINYGLMQARMMVRPVKTNEVVLLPHELAK